MSRRLRLLVFAAVTAVMLGTTACTNLTGPQSSCTQGNNSECPGGG